VGPDYNGPPWVNGQVTTTTPGADSKSTGWQAPLPQGGQSVDLTRWWQQFNDLALDALIFTSQSASPSIAQAAARIEQARAVAVAADAIAWPSVDATASASRGTLSFGTDILLVNQARVGIQAGWELDLFGRIRREREAATARVEARTDDWHEARVSLAAEVATQYLQFRFCEALVAISLADAQSRAGTAAVTTKAAQAGFQAPAAAALTQASAAEAASRLTAQRAECEIAVKSLVALTGQDEPTVRQWLAATSGGLPVPKAFEVKAVPAALLSQRPDLAAAERALAAASADIGVAEGDRYPRLSLLGSVAPLGLRTGSFSGSLLNWSIGPSVSLPIFDAGRRAANVDAAKAAYTAAEVEYRARARQAVREVEEALVRLDSAARRETDARTAARGYQQALEAAQVRWKTGLGSLLELEDARRYALAANSTLVTVRRDRVAAWVALYRALGGGWSA
jgi:NodT family efflux transporter outer membrane factor (OMF) lipoprotein